MNEQKQLPKLSFCVSHRKFGPDKCDEMDCFKVGKLIKGLASKYRDVAEIDYFDWQLRRSLDIEYEDEIFEHPWDGVIFLVEGGRMGKIQKKGFDRYKEAREAVKKGSSGKIIPKFFVYIKRPDGLSEEDFDAYRESILGGDTQYAEDFRSHHELTGKLEKALEDFIKDKIKQKGIESNEDSFPGGGQKPSPRWIPWVILATVLVVLLALGLMKDGPRGDDSAGNGFKQFFERFLGKSGPIDSLKEENDSTFFYHVPSLDTNGYVEPGSKEGIGSQETAHEPGKGRGTSVKIPEQIIHDTPEYVWTDEDKKASGLVFISARGETLSGEAYDNFGSRIRGMVTSAGLMRTDDRGKALWVIEVTGKARKCNEEDGIYFSYVDIDLDVMNLVSGEAVHSGTLVVPGAGREGVKGGSAKSFEDAVERAYMNAYPLIEEEIKRINDH